MNPFQLASRMVWLAKQLRGEADRQSGEIRVDLIRASSQLIYAHRAAFVTDPERRAEVDALVQGAIDYLVDVVTQRTERELARGVTS